MYINDQYDSYNDFMLLKKENQSNPRIKSQSSKNI